LSLRILVTGASGFIGFGVLSMLSRVEQNQVFAVCRFHSEGLEELSKLRPNIKIICDVDLTNSKDVEKLPHNIDYVVHAMACAKFEGESAEVLRTANIEATRYVVEHLKKYSINSIKRILFTSTIGVHDRPINYDKGSVITESSPFAPMSKYGKTKLEAERIIAGSSLPYCIARLSWVYGPNMRKDSHIRVFEFMAKNNNFLSRVDFPGRVMAAFIDDVSSALEQLLLKPELKYQEYLIANADPISLGNIFSQLRIMNNLPRCSIVIARPIKSFLNSIRFLIPQKLRLVLEENYMICSVGRLNQEDIYLNTSFSKGISLCLSHKNWHN